LLAYAEQAAVEAAGGEIFPEGARIERVAAGGQFFDAFEGDDEDGLVRSAVDLGVRVRVALDA
jgi:hypothetical protein